MAQQGLPKPEFINSRGEFKVILYNDAQRSTVAVDSRGNTEKTEYTDEKGLIAFCSTPRTRAEIIEYLAISSGQYALRRYLDPLVKAGVIVMTMPDKPRSPNQQYVAATE